jgi:hypothetical protein
VDRLTISKEKDLTRLTALSNNSVLKTYSEVIEAKKKLKDLKLFLHHDPIKSWDTYRMIEIINKARRDSFVLDVGCNDSPILPMLRRLGFRNLYGCDLHLKPRFKHKFLNTLYSLIKKEYRPIIRMHHDKSLNLSIQNLENTNYQNNMFDFVTSLSVLCGSVLGIPCQIMTWPIRNPKMHTWDMIIGVFMIAIIGVSVS